MQAVRTDQYKYARDGTRFAPVCMPSDVFASASGQTVADEYCSGTHPREELCDF